MLPLTAGRVARVRGFLSGPRLSRDEGGGERLGAADDVTLGGQAAGGQHPGVAKQQAVVRVSIFVGQVEGDTASCLLTQVSTFSKGLPPLGQRPLAILPSFPPAGTFPKQFYFL